jgi:hypothetical protein
LFSLRRVVGRAFIAIIAAGSIPRQCREDGAEDVTDKEGPNFCDWFKPSEGAFDPNRKSEADAAKDALAALFGNGNDD